MGLDCKTCEGVKLATSCSEQYGRLGCQRAMGVEPTPRMRLLVVLEDGKCLGFRVGMIRNSSLYCP